MLLLTVGSCGRKFAVSSPGRRKGVALQASPSWRPIEGAVHACLSLELFGVLFRCRGRPGQQRQPVLLTCPMFLDVSLRSNRRQLPYETASGEFSVFSLFR